MIVQRIVCIVHQQESDGECVVLTFSLVNIAWLSMLHLVLCYKISKIICPIHSQHESCMAENWYPLQCPLSQQSTKSGPKEKLV